MNAWEELQALGKRVAARWNERARDERAFAEIALAGLRETDLDKIRLSDLLEIALSARELPAQADMEATFGQPPVSVFRGEGFYIEALFWVDALLSIHRHRFSGAFAVLEGASIHTRYQFREQARVCSALLLGRLELTHAEILKRGECCPIHAGNELIHATYHLDAPAVTLLVRTHNEWGMGPPYDYRFPSVAYDPSYEGRMVRKRLQVLDMLRRVNPEQYVLAVLTRLPHEDLFGVYLLLEQLFETTTDGQARERAVGLARERHGEIVDALRASFEVQDRLRQLMHLRERTADPDLRFFLALLANVPGRRHIISLVRAYRPSHDPIELVMGWLERMACELLYSPLSGSSALSGLVRRLLAGEAALTHEAETLRDSLVLGPLVFD